MRREQLLHIGIGAAIAIAVIIPLGVFAFVKSGVYNVGASSPHSRFTEWITHETMIHSVGHRAQDVKAPETATDPQIRRGFCEYETHCVACHGASAVSRQQWVSGMEPAPPYLLDVTRRFSPRELFWITKNGIKMTGMPAWRNSMSDEQLWDLVGFLEAMPRMDSGTYVQWRSEGFCPPISDPLAPGPLSIPRP